MQQCITHVTVMTLITCYFCGLCSGCKWTFLGQILVGRSSWPQGRSYEMLVPGATFMSPADCKRGNNKEVVRMFKYGENVASGVTDNVIFSGISLLSLRSFLSLHHHVKKYRWEVRSRRWGCLVTWFCYHLIAKPGNNKTAAPSWPDPVVGDYNMSMFQTHHDSRRCFLNGFVLKWMPEMANSWVYVTHMMAQWHDMET